MTNTLQRITPYLFTLALAGILVFAYSDRTAHATDATTNPANVATSSNPTVTTTAGTVFATSTACTSRVISTSAQPIMITFSDNQGKIPTGSFGHLQAASTTVAYDAGLYGCGRLQVYSFATQLITVTELR